MHPFGYVSHLLWNTNQAVTSSDLNRMGKAAQASVLNLLAARLLYDATTEQPRTGNIGDDCLCVVTGALEVTVLRGITWRYDSSETNAWAPHYKVAIVEADEALTLDAHDAQARIDVISVAPAEEDDESAGRVVWDGSALTGTTVDTRRKLTATLTVTKGTPGVSPAVPATPSGHVKLAQVTVPAVAGAITAYDFRSIIGLKTEWFGDNEVTGAKLSEPVLWPEVEYGAEAANTIRVTIKARTWDGATLFREGGSGTAKARRYALRLLNSVLNTITSDASQKITMVTGTAVSSDLKPSMLAEGGTNVDGDGNQISEDIVVDVFSSAIGTIYLEITPVSRYDLPMPGTPTIVPLTFA